MKRLRNAIFALTVATTFSFGANESVLFVVDEQALIPGDAVLKSVMDSLTFSTTVVTHDDVVATDAQGKDLIVISESVSSGKVGDIFVTANVPVVTYEAWLFDDFGLTGLQSDTDYAKMDLVTQFDIINADHYLAAGLQGTVDMFLSEVTVTWGVPGDGAIKIAKITGDSEASHWATFAYNTDATLVDGSKAPAPRVALSGLSTAIAVQTVDADKLFSAACTWALNPTSDATVLRMARPDSRFAVQTKGSSLQYLFGTEGARTITVFDLTGRRVAAVTTSEATLELPVSAFATGTYVTHINANGESIAQQFTIGN